MTERRGRRRRKLLDDLKERRGYCHLKQEALDRTMWRAGFGRDFGPVVRDYYMNVCFLSMGRMEAKDQQPDCQGQKFTSE